LELNILYDLNLDVLRAFVGTLIGGYQYFRETYWAERLFAWTFAA